jgi:HEAT repeat protein
LEIFKRAALQERNRVAGNGLVGLFNFNDPLAEEVVMRMARHQDSGFRATAAWAIGRVYWREGAELLRELRKDHSEKVRINAERSILRIARRYPGAA